MLRNPVRLAGFDYKVSFLVVLAASPLLFYLMSVLFPYAFVCPYLALTGRPCPLCGTTRAIELLFKGNAEASLHTNPMGLIVVFTYPILLSVHVLMLFMEKRYVSLQIWSTVILSFSAVFLYFALGASSRF